MRNIVLEDLVDYQVEIFGYLTLDFFTRQAFFNKKLSNISEVLIPIKVLSSQMGGVDLID
jgi:hypothetical protein